ncbi:PKD domain-containing protein [Candidatus Bipolaricaulota bacterium]|nr:PKD domain-containing protein [Candidatus Bipolaricaulota bacterium]
MKKPKHRSRLLSSTTLLVAFLMFAPLAATGQVGNVAINVSVVDGAGEPVRDAQVFLDKAYIGKTDGEGNKNIDSVDPGKHLVVVKKPELGRTSANIYISEEEGLQLKLKLLPNKSTPSPAQFGYNPRKPRAGKKLTLRGFTPMWVDSSDLNYKWDLRNDGSIDEEGMKVSVSFPSSDNYPVTLIVTRNGELVGKQTREIEVKPMNISPKASFSIKDEEISADKPLSFDASDSSDRDGIIEEYLWKFDSKNQKRGEVIHHKFNKPGTHEVTLIVTDDFGETARVTKQISVAPRTYISRLFYKEGQGMDWVTSNKLSRNEPMQLTNSDKQRELNLFFERRENEIAEIIQQLKPTSDGIIDVIGQTVIKPSKNIIKLRGKGFVQTGIVTYDLDKGVRKKEIQDWNGNTKYTSTSSARANKKLDQTQHSFTIHVVSRESLESIALDILVNQASEPLVVATTELFNYRKLNAVKTSLKSGIKPARYNLSPHLMVYPPKVIYETERASFEFISFDPDGPLEKFVVDWGDGNKEDIEQPISGRNKVYHTYTQSGKYDVTVKAFDTSEKENNFRKVTFTVTVREKEKERKPKKDEREEPVCGSYSGFLALN